MTYEIFEIKPWLENSSIKPEINMILFTVFIMIMMFYVPQCYGEN
jgi:hypothetical protein